MDVQIEIFFLQNAHWTLLMNFNFNFNFKNCLPHLQDKPSLAESGGVGGGSSHLPSVSLPAVASRL
jgi:hypothetical protein